MSWSLKEFSRSVILYWCAHERKKQKIKREIEIFLSVTSSNKPSKIRRNNNFRKRRIDSNVNAKLLRLLQYTHFECCFTRVVQFTHLLSFDLICNRKAHLIATNCRHSLDYLPSSDVAVSLYTVVNRFLTKHTESIDVSSEPICLWEKCKAKKNKRNLNDSNCLFHWRNQISMDFLLIFFSPRVHLFERKMIKFDFVLIRKMRTSDFTWNANDWSKITCFFLFFFSFSCRFFSISWWSKWQACTWSGNQIKQKYERNEKWIWTKC